VFRGCFGYVILPSKPLCYNTGATHPLTSRSLARKTYCRTFYAAARISLKRLALPVGCMTFQLRLTMVSMRLDYEWGCLLVLVLGMRKKRTAFTAICFFSYLYVGNTPHPFSVSSSTNEGTLLTVQKSQLLMLTSFRYR